MARSSTGIDDGRGSACALRGQPKGNTFRVTGFTAARLPMAAGASEGHTMGWDALAEAVDFPVKPARVGLSGRDVNVRYTRVPRLPDWQLRNLMRFEVAEIGDQSGAEVTSDFNLLPEIPEVEGEDVVLLAMARESLLEQEFEGLRSIGGVLDCFSPSAVALYNAWARYGVVEDDTVLIANIGYDNTDVVIARGPDLLFARNLSGGGRLFDEAIGQRFGVRADQARKLKHEAVSLAPGARYPTPNHERASRACTAAAGQLVSLLQSAVLFCKSQIKISGLKLDRVMLCGGGAALEGLPAYLASALGVRVELFDPFRVVDLGALDPGDAELLEEHKLESVVALGLATMGSDPGAYGLEILPKATAKARAFWGGSVWLIAAAVLAVLYLGFKVVHYRGQIEVVAREVGTLEGELRRRERVHNEVVRLQEENEAVATVVQELWGTAGLGEQVARLATFLGHGLPAQFWVTQLESRWTFDPELGVERGHDRPVVLVRGRVREGTDSPSQRFEQMVSRLAAEHPALRFRRSVDRERFTLDATAFAPPTPGDGDGDDPEGGL